MVLTYAKYIELMSALDEHCKGTLEKKDLQNAIFDHYIDKEYTFVSENINGDKRVFFIKRGFSNKCYNRERKVFRHFMNTELTKKRKRKKKK